MPVMRAKALYGNCVCKGDVVGLVKLKMDWGGGKEEWEDPACLQLLSGSLSLFL